jgi:hypothetical protein
MVASTQQFRLAQLPASARVVISCFVALMGIGYLVSIFHMYNTYSMADGKAGLTPQDVQLQIAGKREKTLLESKIAGGSMEQYLTDPAQRTTMLAWIHGGASEARFGTVQPIFAKNCQGCHKSDGAAKFRPLTNFAQVATVTKVDRGETPATWARVAHIHVQSIGMIFFLMGMVFCFCGLPEKLKMLIAPLPFLSLVLDFGVRAMVPTYPFLVYVVMGAGAIGGLSTAIIVLTTFWELWLATLKPEPAGAPDLVPAQQA